MPDTDLSEKKGVIISRKTGGAYVDTREVIEDELARIRTGHTDDGQQAEYARLQLAVVEAAKADRGAETSGKCGRADLDAMIALRGQFRNAVSALIAFEAEQKIGE